MKFLKPSFASHFQLMPLFLNSLITPHAVAKTACSQIRLENFLEGFTLETNTSTVKQSNRTSFSSSIDTFLSLVLDKVYILCLSPYHMKNICLQTL